MGFTYTSLLLIICFCWDIHLCVSKPYSVLNQTVQTCDDVLSYYQYLGYQIKDCMEDLAGKSLFWRIDTPLSWDYARSACKASTADLAVPKSGWQRSIIAMLLTLKVQQAAEVWVGVQRQNGAMKFIDGSDIPAAYWPTYTPNWSNCINNQDCGYAFISWYTGTGAFYSSYYSGFFYCTSLACSVSQPFVCQVHL